MENIDPIRYLPRIREYYLALGYEVPYRWAVNTSVPFTPLKKPLSQCRIAVVTTAAPFKPDAGDQGPGAPYNGAAKFFEVYDMAMDTPIDLRISHIAYDRDHTSAADINSWFPGQKLLQLVDDNVVGSSCSRFFGLPTNRSHRITKEVDCPELVRRLLTHSVDGCVLVPNCPVCHQSVSLAATQLEAAGISTVIMGCAKDIVEHVGVPRFLFSDFPLGNAAGKPQDDKSQLDTLALALRLLEHAPAARTTVQSPQSWHEDHSWKQDYCNVSALGDGELAARRAEFDKQKRRSKVR